MKETLHSGLKPELRQESRCLLRQISSYDEFKKEVRKIEAQLEEPPADRKPSKAAVNVQKEKAEQDTCTKELPKSVSAPVVGSCKGTYEISPHMVGEVNEAAILLNGHDTTALLDTGSCVSIVAETFYREHLGNTELKPLQDILHVECADGQSLPYLGYIEVELSVPEGVSGLRPKDCLLLVTPDTRYSAKTPVILGTNILQELLADSQQHHGKQFLQRAQLHMPWFLSFRTMVLREKKLAHGKDRIAIVRSGVAEKVILGPNETKPITGNTG